MGANPETIWLAPVRAIEKLSEAKIRAIAKPGLHSDGAGLYLQVSKKDDERVNRSWVLRFRINGNTREAGLGSLLDVTLVAARRKAEEYRTLARQSIDPIEHARAARAAGPTAAQPRGPIFRSYAEECIEGWQPDWKNPKLAGLWRATLRDYAYPVIGDLPLAAIETSHILEILKPIWRTKSETASRVRERIERILAAASVEGLRVGNPAVWKGHLEQAKGLGKKRKPVPFKSLSYRQLPTFLIELRKRESVAARALEFVILAAARSGEVRGARWPEIDREARTWIVPADRTKQGREHVVPLCDRAFQILDEVAPLRDLGGAIFPGVRHGQPLSDMTLSMLVRAMKYDCVPHGFRATFKTWAEEETQHANVVIEAALGHIVGDKVEQSYMRGDRLAKRRALMDEWGEYCVTAPVRRVVPFSVAAK